MEASPTQSFQPSDSYWADMEVTEEQLENNLITTWVS